MLLTFTLGLFLITPQRVSPRPHLPASQVSDIATILAHDEGWPLGSPDYSLDPMKPDVDDGFDSIGVYKKAHLVRMYSIDRTTARLSISCADARSSVSKTSKNSSRQFAAVLMPLR